MTSAQLVRHMSRVPFMPFRLFLADGRVMRVEHPNHIAYIPGARTCVVADPEALVYDTVDLLLVTSIQVGDVRGDGRTARRRGKR